MKIIAPIALCLSLIFLSLNGSAQSSNRKEKLEPITLFTFKINYEAKVGQQLEFSYEKNASVGVTANYQLEDKSYIDYEKTEISTPNATEGAGGYNENVTYIFKALKVGKSKIVIKEYDQLELKEVREFIITVKE